MKGDGGRNGSEEKGRAEKETPATRESSEDRMEKDSWQRDGHALVWGQLVSWVQPWTLGPRTDREESKAQGLRAKRAAEDHPAILAGCTPRKVKRTPEVRTWHRLWADSSPTSSPATPQPASPRQKQGPARQPRRWQGGGSKGGGRTEQENRQTDRQTEMSRHPSLEGDHFLIRTSLSRQNQMARKGVCVAGRGGGGGRNHPILG